MELPLIALVLILAMLFQMHYEPYLTKRNNLLELALLFVSEAIIFIGIFFVKESDQLGDSFSYTIVAGVIVVLFIASAGLIASSIIADVRGKFLVKGGKEDEAALQQRIYSGEKVEKLFESKPAFATALRWFTLNNDAEGRIKPETKRLYSWVTEKVSEVKGFEKDKKYITEALAMDLAPLLVTYYENAAPSDRVKFVLLLDSLKKQVQESRRKEKSENDSSVSSNDD